MTSQGAWLPLILMLQSCKFFMVILEAQVTQICSMNVLRLITDFIKMSKVWFLSMEFYGVWQEVIKSVISLKTFILQIWVTWASKITIKNFQLCSIKIKGSHAPCDVNATALYICSYQDVWNFTLINLQHFKPPPNTLRPCCL